MRAHFLHCFNGAAAKSSGKSPVALPVISQTQPASMGPPLKAAENRIRSDAVSLAALSFNGAAAKSSGKCHADSSHVAFLGPLQWGRR